MDRRSFTGSGAGSIDRGSRGAGRERLGSPQRRGSSIGGDRRSGGDNSSLISPFSAGRSGGRGDRSATSRNVTPTHQGGYGSERASSQGGGDRMSTNSRNLSPSQRGRRRGMSVMSRESGRSGTSSGGGGGDRASSRGTTTVPSLAGAFASNALTGAASSDERSQDPKFTVREEGTDLERIAEVSLLLARGRSHRADEVLRQMKEPDYVVANRRRQQRLGPDDLPTAVYQGKGQPNSSTLGNSSLSSSLSYQQQLSAVGIGGVENSFDLWFLELSSMEDHLEVASTLGGEGFEEGGNNKGGAGDGGKDGSGGAAVPGSANNGNANSATNGVSKTSKALAQHRRNPMIAEYVYRIHRLIKFHHFKRWKQHQLMAQKSEKEGRPLMEMSVLSSNEASMLNNGSNRIGSSSYVDDDECIPDLGWYLDSFKERDAMRGAMLEDDSDNEEDPLTRENRIRKRRAIAHKANDEDTKDESNPSALMAAAAAATSPETASATEVAQQQQRISTVRRHGPPDAGTFFILPEVGFGSVLGGSFAADLEEKTTDYKPYLLGDPPGLRKRIRKHVASHAYGEQLLQHFVSTVGPEPPRERFGARCRRYLLGRHATLIPHATKMLSEVFHNYLRVLAITFRLLVCGIDATVDTLGITDVAMYAIHPPAIKTLERALAEEEAEAKARLIRSTMLSEVSSANSFVSINKTQQALKARLKEQRRLRRQYEKNSKKSKKLFKAPDEGEAEDLDGFMGPAKEDSDDSDADADDDEAIASMLSGGALVVSSNRPKTPLEKDVLESEEHIADPFSRIWCAARLLMNIYLSLTEGSTHRNSHVQVLRRRMQSQYLERFESLTCFYRMAELLKTNMNGSPMDDSVEEPRLTDKQLLFANFLNVASLVAPAIEVATERLLMLELTKRFGPEPTPPLPTIHTCEPLPSLARLKQFCRMDRFYRFHERDLDEMDRLTYQKSLTNAYDSEYIGARHTRKSLWQIFCRYYYYADDRQTTDPSSSNEADEAFYKGWKPPEKVVEFGSPEYFEKRFAEMTQREKAFYNEENFKRLIARHRRLVSIGTAKKGEDGDGANAAFSTLTSAAEDEREERRQLIETIPIDNVHSPFFGEMKSLRNLWQQLLFKYGEEPFSESEVADQARRAAERAEKLEPERKKLATFYQYYAPEKTAADIEAALDRFCEDIPKMWQLLEQKYGPLHIAISRDVGGGPSIAPPVAGGGGGAADASVTGALTSGVGTASLHQSDTPQLAQLATVREILLANGDPFKQLWVVDALIKMISKHVEQCNAAGVPHTPLVNPFQPIQITHHMLDVFMGTEAAVVKQRHLLTAYFHDKGYSGVTQEAIGHLIDHYRYSPMGFEHMWAELTAYYGPDRDPIDTENDASRAELEFIAKRKHTNDADVVGKGLVARKSRVVGTSDQAHWMLEREDILHAEKLENYFDYYSSGGDHFLDLITQEEMQRKLQVGGKVVTMSGGPGRENAAATATADGAAEKNKTTTTNLADHYREDPNPNKYHRHHEPRSKEDLLALQRRFLQGSAGGYAVMWRSLEAKYGPQPPESFTRYNMEIKRLKREAMKRQKASQRAGAGAGSDSNRNRSSSYRGASVGSVGSNASYDVNGLLMEGASTVYDSFSSSAAMGGGGGGVADDLDLSPNNSPRGVVGNTTRSASAVAKTASSNSTLHPPPPTITVTDARGGGGGVADPLANSQSQTTSLVVLGSEQRKGALLAQAAHSDPEKALRDIQSSVISTREEEQALIDMFLRWRGDKKKEIMSIGKRVAVGDDVPTLIFESDLEVTAKHADQLEGGLSPAVAPSRVYGGVICMDVSSNIYSAVRGPPSNAAHNHSSSVLSSSVVTPLPSSFSHHPQQQQQRGTLTSPPTAPTATSAGAALQPVAGGIASSGSSGLRYGTEGLVFSPVARGGAASNAVSRSAAVTFSQPSSSPPPLPRMAEGAPAIKSASYNYYNSFYLNGDGEGGATKSSVSSSATTTSAAAVVGGGRGGGAEAPRRLFYDAALTGSANFRDMPLNNDAYVDTLLMARESNKSAAVRASSPPSNQRITVLKNAYVAVSAPPASPFGSTANRSNALRMGGGGGGATASPLPYRSAAPNASGPSPSLAMLGGGVADASTIANISDDSVAKSRALCGSRRVGGL